MIWWVLAVLLIATFIEWDDEGAPCPDLPNDRVGETARLDAPRQARPVLLDGHLPSGTSVRPEHSHRHHHLSQADSPMDKGQSSGSQL